jgi:hypothetical protein
MVSKSKMINELIKILFLNIPSQYCLNNGYLLIITVGTNTYYILFFMKRSKWSHKLRYEKYLKLIFRYLLHNIYTELICMRIPYGDISYVYEKTHVTVM